MGSAFKRNIQPFSRLIVSNYSRPPISQTAQSGEKPPKLHKSRHFKFNSNTLVVKMVDRHRVKIPQSQIVHLPGEKVEVNHIASYTMADILPINPRY
jgi:hypothetical protein